MSGEKLKTYKITEEKINELYAGIENWPYKYTNQLVIWLGKNLEEIEEVKDEKPVKAIKKPKDAV